MPIPAYGSGGSGPVEDLPHRDHQGLVPAFGLSTRFGMRQAPLLRIERGVGLTGWVSVDRG